MNSSDDVDATLLTGCNLEAMSLAKVRVTVAMFTEFSMWNLGYWQHAFSAGKWAASTMKIPTSCALVVARAQLSIAGWHRRPRFIKEGFRRRQSTVHLARLSPSSVCAVSWRAAAVGTLNRITDFPWYHFLPTILLSILNFSLHISTLLF